ncbi:Na(+)/H(+) antiporter subunit C [Kocuria sp. JC486]|uniref:Na(+)/H(+) antiporter subunit C n=1 Tax=Kocuria soli TaxID=2485125 RepID=A0A3N4A0K4_9MICC|nr:MULTISPECIES: Na(+)/H(+) antiporter subunit C [Kocuria]NHU85041.1 Na(+)/H(+) antiporter subunit C [Kocuria sp. JC486]ROZ65634.1 Na(+)/H(+) antiporter subunit C [Kocuria soli]
MSVNLTLLIVMGVLYSVGVYLVLERSLTRVVLGLMLLTNATNLLILHAAGIPGLAPLYTEGTDPRSYTDPLPQALVLTAIVIGLAVTAFMLGLIYRSWALSRRDVITDDAEDRRVATQSAFVDEEDADLPQDTSEFDDEQLEAHERENEQRHLRDQQYRDQEQKQEDRR